MALSSPEKGLRPFSHVESQRLLCRLWLLLSGYVPISIEVPMTFGALNDDCLLLLLDTLSMSQLLQLRGVSRRLCHLIERHSLRKYKTLIFAYREKIYKDQTGEDTIRLHFASRTDACWDIGSRTIFLKLELIKLSERMYIPLRIRAWPLSLPRLLPNLLCLTLEHVLLDQVKAPSEEQLAVNRRFVPYLNSNWSRTLTTLYLYIHVPASPQSDNASFAQLNQLTSLKHLFLEFFQFHKPKGSPFHLPDSMPIFGQLQCFLLRNYAGSNTVTLLHQLGPDLSSLSLRNVICSEDDCIAFLHARPNYARTLKTFEVSLKDSNWKVFTEVTQSLTSLVEFHYSPQIAPRAELDSIFTDLSLLPNLQSNHWVLLFVEQLRVLLLRKHMPGTLPRLTSIRNASIAIYNRGANRNQFEPSELFDTLLSLLSQVFCRLEWLAIHFITSGGRRHKALSKQLSTKVGQLFPTLKHHTAHYVE